jgi:hypothetical protein
MSETPSMRERMLAGAGCHDRNEHRGRRSAAVVSDLPANVVAVGNPAQVICTFED